uniref:DNA helicase n=1 Tax=Octopus bimaculoides TaxID=37653 RepID=A0A0L8G6D6_OCTBM
MLYGSIVHCLLQEVLRNKIFKEKEIILLTKSIMKRKYILHEIYGLGTDESVVLAAVLKYIPNIVKWIEHHTDFMKQQSGSDVSRTIVTSVCDIEENIWSPRFGLKGKIDLTVEIKTHNLKRKVVPLELKTGNPSFSAEHKGQVTLYTMMMSDRREDPKEGLLLYLKDQPNMSPVSAEHQNKRGLIQLRNEILYYIQNSLLRENSLPEDLSKLLGKLPEPINNVSACSKCPHLLSCSIYQNFSSDVENMTKNRKELHQISLSHLSQSHIIFFIRWCIMIEFEKQSSIHGEGIRDIWCSTGIDSLHQSFEPINTVGLNVHDSVAISVEDKQQIVICRGYIYSISEDHLVVMCDRSFDDHLNVNTEIFKVDKCSDWENWGTCYNNLITLMANTAHSERLRQLIIDHEKPRVHSTLGKSTVQKVKSIFKPLNKLQKVALLKVFMSEDYVVICGYPGTGKTSTIVALIQMLVASGISILVASFTHSAVDNILLKLRKEKIQFLRMGRKDRIHPDIYPYSTDELTKNVKSVQELKAVYESINVVATTCVGMSHTLFSQCQRQFDVCIIDESSQVMLPMCLGPLFAAKKFILVGDSKQLPPIVQSDQAKSLGMDKSLFVELEDKGATVQLNLQYRMNREIMLLSNELIYEGCLQCGNEEVATRTIQPSKCVKRVPAPETYNTRGEVQNNIEAQLIAMIVSAFQTKNAIPNDWCSNIINYFKSKGDILERKSTTQTSNCWIRS